MPCNCRAVLHLYAASWMQMEKVSTWKMTVDGAGGG